MTKPLITVLMTVYNGGDYLKSSIESVLNQSYKDFELLIIDDKSTDHSLEIIRSYPDKRITLHSNVHNLGQTKSLNLGLQLARGDYIARIDADDAAFAPWLKRQLAFLDKNPQYAVVSTKAVVIDQKNRIKKILNSPLSWDEVVFRSLLASPINHVGSVYLKEVILNHGGYDEKFKIAADFDLWSTLIRGGYKIATAPEVLMAIRVHQNSLSRTENKRESAEVAQVIRKNILQFTDFKISEDDVNLLVRFFYSSGTLSEIDFKKAQEIWIQVCGKIKPVLLQKPSLIEQRMRKSLKRIYVKRILDMSVESKSLKTRDILMEFMKHFGYVNIFSLFYLMSFLGESGLRRMPLFYSKFTEILTQCQLRNKFRIKFAGQ